MRNRTFRAALGLFSLTMVLGCLSLREADAVPQNAPVSTKKAVSKKTVPTGTPPAKTGGTSAAATKNTAVTKKAVTKKAGVKTGKKGPAVVRRAVQQNPTPDRYRDIQQALASKGYLKQEPNGVWDSQSTDALRQFQTDQKLDPSGKINAPSLIGLGLGPKFEDASANPPPVPLAPADAPRPASTDARPPDIRSTDIRPTATTPTESK